MALMQNASWGDKGTKEETMDLDLVTKEEKRLEDQD
jgi:hypothetical protein